MWRHGALASLGFLTLATQAIAIFPGDRGPAHSLTAIAAHPTSGGDAGGRARPRYGPPPVFVPRYTRLSTYTILDGREVTISATIWRDERGKWVVRAAVRGEHARELPPIFSASLAVKSDHRWWRTDMELDARERHRAAFGVASGPRWGRDADARVRLYVNTPGGRRMIQWDNVRVD